MTEVSQSTIEDQVRSSRGLLIGTTILGLCAVAADFVIVVTERSGVFPRLLLGTIVLMIYIQLVAKFGAGTFPGFRLPPRAEWKRWLLLFGGVAVVLGVAAILSRVWFPQMAYGHREIASIAVYNCMVWPIYEEVIYRVALCTPSAALLGRPWAIVANGLVFGALHVAYGNPDPSNAIGGFALAWIFLRSRSVTVSIVGHSIGNFAINFAPIIFTAAIS
jgi:membrane protease YdiL (CAAX protease family)